jgi:hypothetical protein
MHFVLDHTFDEILSWKQLSDPLEIFMLLQFRPEYLKSFSFFYDLKNQTSLELSFSRPLNVDRNFFEGFPPSIFLCENANLTSADGSLTLPLSSQVEKGGNERILSAAHSINNVEKISFKNIFGELLPPDISSKNKIEAYLDRMRLKELIDANNIEPLLFIYFDQSWRISRKNFLGKGDFEFRSDDGSSGLQINLTNNPREFDVIDAKYSSGKHVGELLVKLLPNLRKFGVGLVIRIWDQSESYCSTNARLISTRKQKLIKDAKPQLEKFLSSDKVKSKAQSLKRQLNTAAAEKLDERKKSIVSNQYVKLTNGARFKVPGNETETVILFSGLLGSNLLPIHFFEILQYSSSEGIDAICSYKIEQDDVLKNEIAVEFEHKFGNFFTHKHPVQHVELIICWEIDTMKQNLEPTGYPWLFKLKHSKSDCLVVEISSFNLKG